MAELPYQTWQRVTGKPWSEASKGGFTTGTAQANLTLQQKLLSGWNPYKGGGSAPAPAAPAAPAASTGGGDLVGWAEEQRKASEALLQKQQAEQESLFKQYQQAVAGQEPMEAAYTRLGQEAGVPQLQAQMQAFTEQMANIQKMISDLDTNVTERTKGTFTTEAQRQRQVAAEQVPLTKSLRDIGIAEAPVAQALSSAQQNIATRLGLISEDQKKQLQPLIMQIDSLSDRFSREINMYNSEKETTLTALLDKLQRQRQLDDREWEQAQQLAAEERQWARDKEKIAMEYTNQVKLTQLEQSAKTKTPGDMLDDLVTSGQKTIASATDMNSAGRAWAMAWNNIKNLSDSQGFKLTNSDIDRLLGYPGGWEQYKQYFR